MESREVRRSLGSKILGPMDLNVPSISPAALHDSSPSRAV
jgi:hypothetical protein